MIHTVENLLSILLVNQLRNTGLGEQRKYVTSSFHSWFLLVIVCTFPCAVCLCFKLYLCNVFL